MRKSIPQFASEDEERDFWASQDATEYIDFSEARPALFPNLKPSTVTVSVRLPESLLDSLKVLAHKKDVPYR
ncbi:MAG: BrnA antitoxin family protein, partial [Armatimonadetes bacterium]|nr:BrnA antitoxin family protein [Armatimonadota bacterium]